MLDLSQFNITAQGLAIVWGITILAMIIIIIILAKRTSDSIKAADQNNGRINQYLAAIPADRIGTVNAIYQNTKKNTGLGIAIGIAGGAFGFQRLYLGKRGSAVLLLLFFWTGIPTIISLFDITAMPKIVSEFNLTVIESLYNQIAAPKIEM